MSEENYNKASVVCKRLSYPFPKDVQLEPGHFCWGPSTADGIHRLYIVFPGNLRPDAIRCVKGAALGGEVGNHIWGWDGNEDMPTLTPSLHWIGHWHGFLRNGQLQSC